jgi:hypothetical protein
LAERSLRVWSAGLVIVAHDIDEIAQSLGFPGYFTARRALGDPEQDLFPALRAR